MTEPFKDICPCFCQVPSIATVISECPLTSLASLATIYILTVAIVSMAVSNPDSFLLNLCDGVALAPWKDQEQISTSLVGFVPVKKTGKL
ncbi:hypothetical protein TNCV_1818031 [Trichonephila clavipes]|nr:hypothetical protein TNCV_1818031 [Trichonephila clavipes]